jgi:hypothetical protein
MWPNDWNMCGAEVRYSCLANKNGDWKYCTHAALEHDSKGRVRGCRFDIDGICEVREAQKSALTGLVMELLKVGVESGRY